MNTRINLLLLCVIIFGCKPKPNPINYGKDLCEFCSMTIMDEKFGAELLNSKGKVFKFDSDECMMNFLKENKEPKFATHLVTNYNQPKELIDASTAFFVQGGEVESPMGGQLASFKNKEDAQKFQQEKKADLLTWTQLQRLDF